ncbi:hypothetical protein WBU96_28185 [Bacillus albus]|uniref:hypothetical protein n=1 Tax=Bacillus albus TaxID=2026189 RepID=UPI0030146048
MRLFEAKALSEFESLYLWAERRAYGEEGSKQLSRQHTQQLVHEFKKISEEYRKIKEAVGYVENGREATIEDHTK